MTTEDDINVAAIQRSALLTQQGLQEPRSSVLLDELPCGYIDDAGVLHTALDLREMSGREEDMLASKKLRPIAKINALMAACVTRIGSITDAGLISSIIPNLLLGDRIFLLFALRRVSLGVEYPFELKCPDELCERKHLFTVDLSTLDVRKMPNPSQRSFTCVVDADRRKTRKLAVSFHLLSGVDEAESESPEARRDPVSYAMWRQLDSIDGAKPTLAQVQALSTTALDSIREAIDKVSGGVDTTVELACPVTGFEFEQDVDLQSGFFFPSAMRRRSKTKSST